jgi:hypothetical protein
MGMALRWHGHGRLVVLCLYDIAVYQLGLNGGYFLVVKSNFRRFSIEEIQQFGSLVSCIHKLEWVPIRRVAIRLVCTL